ncbi:molecular chaperone DnaK [Psychromonas sp. RZ22]|uniref:TraR/DksA C4-type zinc finger protein n=1 Tax=Psychromonas algarum TaxID=2555643 RepID=UPI001067472E|nr:TraR/DksA C4-type zinc finger protein [Psychromonas sp. RZ22]TEW55195.1 molecular chaperone DnaK [Psychromonas sp. RZ22]
MQAITAEQQQLLQQGLLAEFALLKEKVKTRLSISSKKNLNDLVEQIDSMSADTLISNLVHSESHSLNLYKLKIQSIDAALQGMELGLYGLCSDCEEDLDVDELFKNPTMQRCPECEIKYQKQKVKGFKL